MTIPRPLLSRCIIFSSLLAPLAKHVDNRPSNDGPGFEAESEHDAAQKRGLTAIYPPCWWVPS